MDNYLIIMYLLFGLAIVDLVVGVSNDAVNFLNSAIGSKVASFRTILIIASIGIMVGAGFSSGMMEVARKGIFNPGFFTFENIMYVFLAVLLTDIILLDLYNTLGLPTSTTVSIVFELLGAAFTIGLLISFKNGDGFSKIDEFINFASALKIISGIFLSVIISFSVGAIIQYFTRLAFTFDFQKNLKKYGAVFSGLAVTAITYFLVIKGAKGSSFKDDLAWIVDDTLIVVVVSFVFWTVVTQLVMKFTKINPLKIIVLMGTFSLAMAFAGNDLVNFIGVAIAGKQAYMHWMDAGRDLSLKMDFLSDKQPTETLLLFGAGVIMVVTLWFSSKAKKVTETEVGLSRQDDGDEKFKPNFISRALVGSSMALKLLLTF
jgi:phosphate/sulfate permease